MGLKTLVFTSCFAYNISMKTSKLLLLIFVLTFCAPAVFAQKQLKYVPQALKGAKVAPYALKATTPSAVRTGLSVPVTRPHVAAAVERQVAKKIAVEERIARLKANLKKLEEYARAHNNKLPSASRSATESLRKQIISDLVFLKRSEVLGKNHPLCKRYNQLVETDKQQREQEELALTQQHLAILETNLAWLEEYARTHNNKLPRVGSANYPVVLQVHQNVASNYRTTIRPFRRRYIKLIEAENKQIRKEIREGQIQREQQEWEQILQQDRAWKVQPEEIADPADNAVKAAALGEKQIAFPGEVPTEDYINQLLRFYNELDPLGTGAIQ